MNNETVDILSSMTTINKKQVERIFKTLNMKICDDVLENILNNETLTIVDIGVGSLQILVGGDEIRYKFIPSRLLEKNLLNTVETKKSPIETVLEEAIDLRINDAYKDLF